MSHFQDEKESIRNELFQTKFNDNKNFEMAVMRELERIRLLLILADLKTTFFFRYLTSLLFTELFDKYRDRSGIYCCIDLGKWYYKGWVSTKISGIECAFSLITVQCKQTNVINSRTLRFFKWLSDIRKVFHGGQHKAD